MMGWFRFKVLILECRNEIQNSWLNLCMDHMVHVSSRMWRIKNQLSNSTSRSDSVLRLLVLVASRLYWGLQVTSLFSILGCILKVSFEGGILWRAKLRLKGIEGFNLEHRGPPTFFENVGFETEFGKPRSKDLGLHVCLISRLVLFSSVMNGCWIDFLFFSCIIWVSSY